jgi:hypothetical protein
MPATGQEQADPLPRLNRPPRLDSTLSGARSPVERARLTRERSLGAALMWRVSKRLRCDLAEISSPDGSAPLADRDTAAAERASLRAEEYLARMFFDTGLSNHVAAIAATREVTDDNHIVFRTTGRSLSFPPATPRRRSTS